MLSRKNCRIWNSDSLNLKTKVKYVYDLAKVRRKKVSSRIANARRYDATVISYVWPWKQRSRSLTILLKFNANCSLSTCKRIPKWHASTISRYGITANWNLRIFFEFEGQGRWQFGWKITFSTSICLPKLALLSPSVSFRWHFVTEGHTQFTIALEPRKKV